MNKKWKRDTWHYKFNKCMTDKYDTEAKTGLCQYFWFTVWNIIEALGVVIVFALLAIFTCCTVYLIGTFFLGGFGIFYHGDPWGVSVAALTLISVISLLCSVMACFEGQVKFAPDYVTKWFKKADTVIETKSPSLVKEYYKATKTKICPVIKWED